MVSEYPRGENNDCWQLQPRELKETLADYSNSAGCSQRFLATARLQAKTNACWPLEFRGLKHHLVVTGTPEAETNDNWSLQTDHCWLREARKLKPKLTSAGSNQRLLVTGSPQADTIAGWPVQLRVHGPTVAGHWNPEN